MKDIMRKMEMGRRERREEKEKEVRSLKIYMKKRRDRQRKQSLSGERKEEEYGKREKVITLGTGKYTVKQEELRNLYVNADEDFFRKW